mgnify:CR=1 FL=1
MAEEGKAKNAMDKGVSRVLYKPAKLTFGV